MQIEKYNKFSTWFINLQLFLKTKFNNFYRVLGTHLKILWCGEIFYRISPSTTKSKFHYKKNSWTPMAELWQQYQYHRMEKISCRKPFSFGLFFLGGRGGKIYYNSKSISCISFHSAFGQIFVQPLIFVVRKKSELI